MRRIGALELPVHEPRWLDAPTTADLPSAAVRSQEPQVLPRGGVVDLPVPQAGPAPEWYVTAGWAPRSDCAIDVVAFLLDEDEQVAFDEDFVFYGAPENPAGTVRLLTGGPAEQTIALNLASLPPATRKVVVAAAVDGSATFGTVGAIQIGAAPGSSRAPAPGPRWTCHHRTHAAARRDLPPWPALASPRRRPGLRPRPRRPRPPVRGGRRRLNPLSGAQGPGAASAPGPFALCSGRRAVSRGT